MNSLGETSRHEINEKLHVSDDLEVTLRVAREDDMERIKSLYELVYGGTYTLPEVNDAAKMKWALNDPNYLWLLNEHEGGLVGSVIFVVDPANLIGKTFAGVVVPSFRGNKMMVKSIKRGIHYLTEEKNCCELIYAVVRTFVSMGFHRDLLDLGFIDTGIFPNVRKLKLYETHGLKVYYRPGVLAKRKNHPILTPESDRIYGIIRDMLALEMARVEQVKVERLAEREHLQFEIEKSKDVEWEYYRERDKGELMFSFFPLHYPQIRLSTADRSTVVYLHYQENDGYGGITGLKTDQDDLLWVLSETSNYCESMGVTYLELLLPARDPHYQKIAYEAHFIPCAYFPAAKLESDGNRLDYVVCCNTFVPPHFKSLKLTEFTRSYLQAFFKLYTERLWEDLENAQ
ncbi:MAG: hypothetical protein RDV48_08530 [Candidatus Eremiobacteraeota bacterium]|nr:hypothetical protein [Candidatus Eremiobacteraeota bacterium]